MATALGIKFYDKNNKIISFNPNENSECAPSGNNLNKIAKIDLNSLKNMYHILNLQNINVIIASDVENPLLGSNGATYIYGPQKGANTPQMLQVLFKFSFLFCFIQILVLFFKQIAWVFFYFKRVFLGILGAYVFLFEKHLFLKKKYKTTGIGGRDGKYK